LRRLATLIRVLVLGGMGALTLAAQHGEASADRITQWKLVNFLILAVPVGYFIYKKAGGFFSGRTAEIQRGLTEAARLKAEAEERCAAMERRLANLDAEIESLRRQATEESSAAGERLRGETRRGLERIQAQVEQEIATAVKAGRHQLRVYSAELAVGLAAGKIRERMTPEADSAMVASMAEELSHRQPDQPERSL
jgi:F0F1-type ATP synthase membrane subunit b/b'